MGLPANKRHSDKLNSRKKTPFAATNPPCKMDLIKHNSSHLHNINFTNRLTISSVVSGKSRIAIFTLNQHGDKYSINHFKKNITNW